MFLVCFASEKKFPFDYEVPNAVTLAAIEEAESGKLKSYDSVDDFFKKMKL
jgi:antitoxin component of RelBE/YafQ-DinJ toxin-antitoxin module